MSRKRETAKLIEAIKETAKRKGSPVSDLALAEVWDALGSIPRNAPDPQVYYQLIIVRAVAALQTTLHSHVKHIVDHIVDTNQPLPDFEHAITLDMVREFRDKNFTIGDFVAHHLHYSSIPQIEGFTRKLCNMGLSDLIEAYVSPFGTLSGVENLRDTGPLFLSYLGKLFNYRNMLCHEGTFEHAITKDELGHYVAGAGAVSAAFLHFRLSQITQIRPKTKKATG